jgi:TRAP-type mannitol/chloroaromatic compound transport system substrate-binding protein
MLRAACAYALMEMLAGYDARNPRALNRLVAAGAQLVVLSPDILKALRTALGGGVVAMIALLGLNADLSHTRQMCCRSPCVQ